MTWHDKKHGRTSTYRILLLIVSLSVEPIGKHHCPEPAHVVHPHVEALEPADGRLGGSVPEQPPQRPPHLYNAVQYSTVQYSTVQHSAVQNSRPSTRPTWVCVHPSLARLALNSRAKLCSSATVPGSAVSRRGSTSLSHELSSSSSS